MTTKFRYEQNPMMVACHLTSEDGGKAFVFCSVPGGRPMFQFDPKSMHASPIANAPMISNMKQFRAFVESRFADDGAQS